MLARVKLLLLSISFVLCTVETFAGFGQVLIGVNGLTCSQCTRNVELRIRRLPFVRDVQMNLEHTNGIITLKDENILDARAIARAVRDAGFSVRFLKAAHTFPDQESGTGPCFKVRGSHYRLIPGDTVLQGTVLLQFIGADFLPAAELKPWKPALVKRCDHTSSPLYFVTPVNEVNDL